MHGRGSVARQPFHPWRRGEGFSPRLANHARNTALADGGMRHALSRRVRLSHADLIPGDCTPKQRARPSSGCEAERPRTAGVCLRRLLLTPTYARTAVSERMGADGLSLSFSAFSEGHVALLPSLRHAPFRPMSERPRSLRKGHPRLTALVRSTARDSRIRCHDGSLVPALPPRPIAEHPTAFPSRSGDQLSTRSLRETQAQSLAVHGGDTRRKLILWLFNRRFPCAVRPDIGRSV